MSDSALLSYERCLLFIKENIPGRIDRITAGTRHLKLYFLLFLEDISEESH